MADYMTPLEEECHDTLVLVRDWLTKSKSEKLGVRPEPMRGIAHAERAHK